MTLQARNGLNSQSRSPNFVEHEEHMTISFTYYSHYNKCTGLTGIVVSLIGDKGETIDRRTRGATTLGKEAGDCLAARDALEWASPLKCKKFNLLGTYYHITSTLKGGSRKTSWKTNSKVDQLLLKINSFEKVNCKVINPKNFLNLQNLAKMGSSTQSHLMWEANDIATYCQ